MNKEDLTKDEELNKEIRIQNRHNLLQGIAYIIIGLAAVLLSAYSIVFVLGAAYCGYKASGPLSAYATSKRYISALENTTKMLYNIDDDTWERHATEIEQALKYSTQRIDNGMSPEQSLARMMADIRLIISREQDEPR